MSALALAPTLGAADDGALTRLLSYVAESEDATSTAREKAERDRDYFDGKQLTQAEHDALVARGQPPVSFNVIRSRVDFHQGLEKKQRRDPKAWPRNPQDQPAADAFTDGMRYVIDEADYSTVRSAVWRNVTVEGFGGIEAWVTPARDGNYDIHLAHIAWDRLITDPHSSKADFSDARYVGQVMWLDAEEAVERFGEQSRAIIETTLEPTSLSETYDDKPRNGGWADKKRRRVRIIAMWCRHRGVWHHYEFTKGGILSEAAGPYVDQDGESYCPILLESCNVDRDNNRYGVVRDLIDPQDEINKRRSKALHLLTMQGVIADNGAVANVAQTRKDIAKPDFYIEKQPNSDFQIIRSTELAAGQARLGSEAMAYVMQSGPNAALLGKGTEDQSGKAIEAQQAGGLIEHGDLLDTLRRMDRRVFRLVASLIKQFWTAEKWIRVTDDELAPRWVGLNVPQPEVQQLQDPATGQVFERPVVDPFTGQPVVRIENNVAELNVDIIVLDAPDVITLEGENYESVVKLLGAAAQTPPPILKLMVEMHPGLTTRRKKQLLDTLDQLAQAGGQPNPQAQQAQDIAARKAEADIEKTRADAVLSVARAEATIGRDTPPPEVQQAPVGAY